MTPWVARLIPKDDLALFASIRKAVEQMPDLDLGLDEEGEEILIDCHMIARAVAKSFPVQVRDGFFSLNYEHSWVETSAGHLIDVYPVAVIGGPVMFYGGWDSPQRFIYRRISTKELSRGRFGKNSFRRSVRRVTKALRTVLDEH